MEERNGRLRARDRLDPIHLDSRAGKSVVYGAAGTFSSREACGLGLLPPGGWDWHPILPFDSKGPVSSPFPRLAGPLPTCVLLSVPFSPGLPRPQHSLSSLVRPHPSLPALLDFRPWIVTLALRRSSWRLTKPAAEPADAQGTCLRLDCRLELLILPNEPHQLFQFLIFPHQPLDLMPKPLIIGE